MNNQRWIHEIEAWCDNALNELKKAKHVCTHIDEFRFATTETASKASKNKIFFDASIDAYKYFSKINKIDTEKYKPKLIIPLTDRRSIKQNLLPPSREAILGQMSYSPPLLYLIERSMDTMLFHSEEYCLSLFGQEWSDFGPNYKIVYKVWRSEEYLRDGLNEFSRQVEIDYYPDSLIG